MKKLILILLLPVLGNQYLFAQGKQKYEIIYHIGENIGFFPYEKGLNEYLFKGIKQKQITAYEYTDKFGEFSEVLSEQDIYSLGKYYDSGFGDSVTVHPKYWDIEVQSKKGKIKALALTFSINDEINQPNKRVLMKYDECKAYLNTIYQNSLKHQKIDYLEAAWFDYENRSRQLSLAEALEKGLYKGVEKVNGSYPELNINELREKQRAVIKAKSTSPFYMQHAANEKHTILTRSIDFNIYNYPYQYPFYDSLSLKAQVDMIKKKSSYKPEAGLRPLNYFGRDLIVIDSTQNYYPNREWSEPRDNFFQRIYDGVVTGEITSYKANTNLREDNVVAQSIEEFILGLQYYDQAFGDSVVYGYTEFKYLIKEYYYTDLEGNPTRSVIDYLTFVIPQGTSEPSMFGDLPVCTLKFSEVKAYFEKIYQASKGRIASIQNMCMTTALEKHQHYTGTISRFFNPADLWIEDLTTTEEGRGNPKAYFGLMHAVQQELKDKRNLVSDMPSRAKDVVRIFPPILTVYNVESNQAINPENPISAESIIKLKCSSDPYSTDHDANRKYEITSLEFNAFRGGRLVKNQAFKGVSEIDLSTLGLTAGDGVQVKVINVFTFDENGEKMEVKLANPYSSFFIK